MLSRVILCAQSLGMLALAIAATYAGAQDTNKSFAISIATPNATFASGSLIRLDITLTNNTNERVILPNIRRGPEDVRLQPRDSAKREPNSRGSSFSTIIPPKRCVTNSIGVEKWFDLSKPGQYSLQLRIKALGSVEVVESNKLAITVLSKSD